MRSKQPTARIRNDVKKPKKAQNKPVDENYALYQKWIKSKGFKELREVALERDKHTCQFCGRTLEEIADKKITLQAHHKSYRNVGKGNEEELGDIITCCAVCHKGMHSAPSNLRRFTDKSPIQDNIKTNPQMLCNLRVGRDYENK